MNNDAVTDEPAFFVTNVTHPVSVGRAEEITQLLNSNRRPVVDSIEMHREFHLKMHESTIIPFECPCKTASVSPLFE
jgi:hypothetical protein